MNLSRYRKAYISVFVVLFCSACGAVPENPEPASPTPTSLPVPSSTPVIIRADDNEEEVQDEPLSSWYQVFGENQENSGSDILIMQDGGFMIVGGSDSFDQSSSVGGVMLLRTDDKGETIWQKTYGGEGYDFGFSIAEALDGGYIIAGETTSFGNGGSDGYVIKVDGTGQLLWSKTFGGELDEIFSLILPDEDGYFLVGNIVDPNDFITDPGEAGYSGFAGRSNTYIVKIDPAGQEQWSLVFESELNTITSDSFISSKGNLFVLSTIIKYPEKDNDLVLQKMDQFGHLIWSQTWEDGDLGGYAMTQDLVGNILITGILNPKNITPSDIFLLKVDPQGNELFFKQFKKPDNFEIGRDILVKNDGNYAILAFSTPSLYTYQSTISVWIIDSDGEILQESEIALNLPVKGASMLDHPNGGFVITGSVILRYDEFHTLLLKTDASGCFDQ